MRIFVTGGTGLIGSTLISRFRERGDSVVLLTRNRDKAQTDSRFAGCEIVSGDPSHPGEWQTSVSGCDAVVNLVGESIFGNRWTPAVKARLKTSRIEATRNLVAGIERAKLRPSTLIQGSAIGYYGSTGDEKVLETHPPGTDFMAELAREWESAAAPVLELGLRLAPIRTGLVLAKNGGALKVMEPLFKWVPGGAAPIGSGGSLAPARGKQWISWIHLADIVGMILMTLDQPSASGPFNGTAPNPERNVDFSRALAKAVHRPFLPFGPPDALLRLILGEVAGAITQGQRVLPAAALKQGYVFEYPTLAAALESLFNPASASR
jgi:uncharacterized protein